MIINIIKSLQRFCGNNIAQIGGFHGGPFRAATLQTLMQRFQTVTTGGDFIAAKRRTTWEKCGNNGILAKIGRNPVFDKIIIHYKKLWVFNFHSFLLFWTKIKNYCRTFRGLPHYCRIQ